MVIKKNELVQKRDDYTAKIKEVVEGVDIQLKPPNDYIGWIQLKMKHLLLWKKLDSYRLLGLF